MGASKSKHNKGHISCGKCGEPMSIEEFKTHRCKKWKVFFHNKVLSEFTYMTYGLALIANLSLFREKEVFLFVGFIVINMLVNPLQKMVDKIIGRFQ